MKKKILSSILVGICLVAVVLSPYTVFASYLDTAKSTDNYNDLAAKVMLLQAADLCMGNIKSGGAAALLSDSDADSLEQRALVNKYLNLHFEYGKAVIYSSYLEAFYQKDRGTYDGKVWCKEIGDVLVKTLKEFDSYTVNNVKDIICGKGFFNIYYGYSDIGIADRAVAEGLEYREETWPKGWPLPAGVKDENYNPLVNAYSCRNSFDKIKEAVSSKGALARSKDDKDFWVYMDRNENSGFKPSDYLSSKLGSMNTEDEDEAKLLKAKLLQATKYKNFDLACGQRSTSITKEEYDEAKSGGVSNVYAIYNSAASTTCKELAKELDPASSGSSYTIQAKREQDVLNCYDEAQKSIEAIKKVQTYVEDIQRIANGLLEVAKVIQDGTTLVTSGWELGVR